VTTLLAIASLAFASRGARAQDATKGTTAIEHATIYVPGGAPLKDATLLLADGKVKAVGAGVAVPADARRIDGRGKIVTPGLIDPLTNNGAYEVELESDSNDTDPKGDALRPGFRIRDGYNPRSIRIPVERATGVTTEVVAPDEGLLAGEACAVDLAEGAVDAVIARDAVAQVAYVDERAVQSAAGARGAAWTRLRAAIEDARFFAAHRAEYDANRARPLSLARPDLEALVPVTQGKAPLVVVARRASDIEDALKLGDAYKLKIVIAGGTEAWLVADALAARKVPVLIDPFLNLPARFESLHARDDLAAALSRAGVPVIIASFTTDAGRPLWQRAGDAVRFGMDHDAAIRAMTEAPAAAFGLAGRGRIEPGAVANVVVWSGDPLQTSTRVEHVFVRGTEQSLVTRMTELLERYRHLPAPRGMP
jgi:imidazolonepropionase-like amidohydrolase